MFEPSEFSQTARLVTASLMQIEQKVMFETSTKMTPQKDEYKELGACKLDPAVQMSKQNIDWIKFYVQMFNLCSIIPNL